MEAAPLSPSWSVGRLLAFRFALVYWLLYGLPFPVDLLPWTDWLVGPYESASRALTLWSARHVLGIEREIPMGPTGSGDTTFAYVQLFCTLVLAVGAALAWTLAEELLRRRRKNHARLAAWLWTYVRFVLATALVTYGAYKVIPSQFPQPSLDRLAQPFGEASPMGVLWTFMGVSAPYQVFTGIGELVAGVLLFQRRTAVLGALAGAAVMAQVVMLNFAFDVPVKLYSAHLLAMALFLLLPHAANLFGHLVCGRPAAALPVARLFERPALHRGALALRTAFLAWFVWQGLSTSLGGYRAYAVPPASPFDGAWRVTAFASEPDDVLDPGEPWTELVVGNALRIGVRHASGVYERLQLALEESEPKLTLTRRGDPEWKAELAYELSSPERLSWDGTLGGHAVHIDFERQPEREYLLRSRGFHWINEVPFNR